MLNFLRRAILDSENSALDWELYLGPLMLSYNSGVSKTTRVTPFYATFGIDPNVPLWTQEFSTGEIKSDQVSDQLHLIRKAQTRALRIIVQNEQHEQALRQTIPPHRRTSDYMIGYGCECSTNIRRTQNSIRCLNQVL